VPRAVGAYNAAAAWQQQWALALALLAAFWVSSLSIYDAEKTRDALRDRQRVLAGRSPLRWDFTTLDDLAGSHGFKQFEWSESAVHGDLADPYFYLNLEGRFIDARRFPIFRIRLYSEAEDHLRLFHHQFREDRIHFSERIPVRPGWPSAGVPGWKSWLCWR
jgi:hypothetical protein